MGEAIISIKNLVKEYKMYSRKKDRLLEALIPVYEKHTMFRALDNLNLDIHKGEVVGIMGKNGAGKSTLLKMITGVVIPTSGSLEINGKISSLLELGTAFNPDLTGIENIYQHGQVMGLSNEQIEDTKQEIIDFADIGEHLYQPVKTYSSGMFARLAFACAINVNPDILIVDEVLSVGDMAFQLKCFKKFEQFKEQGKTILFVSHSIGDIIDNCNRTIILDKGNKIFDGGTKDGVEIYKKLITGMLNDEHSINEKQIIERHIIEKHNMLVKDDSKTKINEKDNSIVWKKNFNLNPDMIVYGNGEAKIYDFAIFNSKNEFDSVVNNDEEITVKLKIEFYKNVNMPTFSMTIKDFSGKEICGTNTNMEKINTGLCKKGEKYICEFKQRLMLAPGKYTLSLSCSKFDFNGEVIPINRNYDAIIFEVISNKALVGEYRLDSSVKVTKI